MNLVNNLLLSPNDDMQLFFDCMNVQAFSFIDAVTYGWVNKLHADFFGLKAQELCQKNIYSVLDQKTAVLLTDENENIFADKKPTSTIIWLENKDGLAKHLYIKKIPVLDNNNQVMKIFCMINDISNCDFCEHLNENQLELFCRFKPDGTIHLVNDRFCSIFAINRDIVIGSKFFDYINKKEAAAFKEKLLQLSQDNPLCVYEHSITNNNDHTHCLHWINRAICDSTGNVIEYASIGRDITNTKKAENELRLAYKETKKQVVERTQELERINQLLLDEIEERKKTEESIHKRVLFEQTLSYISSQFIRLSDIDEAIIKSLRAMAELFSSDRAYVFLYDDSSDTIMNTHEWCAQGVTSAMCELQDIPISSFTWIIEQFYNNQYLYIKDISIIPDIIINDKKLLEYYSVKSLIIFPIFKGEKLIGCMGFNNEIKQKALLDEDITLLFIFTELLGKILERKQSDKTLKESEEIYRAIFETTSAPTVILKNNGVISMANSKFIDLFGWSSESSNQQKTFWDFVIKEQNCFINPKFSDNHMLDKNGNIRNVYITMDKIPNSEKSIASILDITELKKAERELQYSNQQLKSLLEETVDALASVLEVKDPYTAGHQRKVANLAASIAEVIGLNQEQIEGLKVAGLLHDIGKIYVPSEILNKPSKLSEIEMNLIKEHPRVGYDIVKRINFPWPVAKIIAQHHERLNGSGYPLGLQDKDICLEAKIIAVADVIEAITSHRPYRPAMGIEMAISEIWQNRNILYDSEVVDIFIDLLKNKKIKV